MPRRFGRGEAPSVAQRHMRKRSIISGRNQGSKQPLQMAGTYYATGDFWVFWRYIRSSAVSSTSVTFAPFEYAATPQLSPIL